MRDREVVATIEANGGEFVRQRGSHRRYQATYTTVDGKTATAFATVPMHRGRDIPQGTLRNIQRQMEPAFGKGWLL